MAWKESTEQLNNMNTIKQTQFSNARLLPGLPIESHSLVLLKVQITKSKRYDLNLGGGWGFL